MPDPLRILVLTRSYPADGDLYQYPFVHRRVLGYLAAGHEVRVFRPLEVASPRSHRFDGVTCTSGNAAALAKLTAEWQPSVIAAHGYSEQMHELLRAADTAVPVRAWLHGSEIPGFFRQKALAIADADQRRAALGAVENRRRFWLDLLEARPAKFGLVFVSRSAVDLAREDLGPKLRDRDIAVVPNPIDTDLFAYRPKQADDRFAVLMIRPFDSPTYGNDLAVAAILRLAGRGGFDRMRFTIIGDGPLFDETLKPLEAAGLEQVTIHRRFLTQAKIADLHRRNGIFLVPSRLDTQGVSRDEAMASGLVPVTNAVSAVPEFVDQDCAALAAADDPDGLAEGIWEMVEDPKLFLARSRRAAERVRQQSGHEITIAAELALMAEAAND